MKDTISDILNKLQDIQDDLIHLDPQALLRNKVKDRASQGVPQLVIENSTRKIIFATEALARLFGYYVQELEGQLLDILIPEKYNIVHITDIERYTTDPRPRRMGHSPNIFGRKKDGTEFQLDIGLDPFVIDNVLYTSAITLTGKVIPVG